MIFSKSRTVPYYLNKLLLVLLVTCTSIHLQLAMPMENLNHLDDISKSLERRQSDSTAGPLSNFCRRNSLDEKENHTAHSPVPDAMGQLTSGQKSSEARSLLAKVDRGLCGGDRDDLIPYTHHPSTVGVAIQV